MKSTRSNNRKGGKQTRVMCSVFLILAILCQLALAALYAKWYAYIKWYVLLPCLLLLIEIMFLWRKDDKHIGVVVSFFAVAVFLIVDVGTHIGRSSLMQLLVLFVGVIFAIINTVSAFFGFQNRFGRLKSTMILYLSLILSVVVVSVYVVEGVLTGNYIYVFQWLSILLSCCTLFLLTWNFTFYPLMEKREVMELAELQKRFDRGELTEDEYQRRRQDIINRI